MSANNVDFSGAIREAAKGLGRITSDEAVSRLNTVAQSLAEIDRDAGSIAIRHAADQVEPWTEFLRREVGRWPAPAPEQPATATSASRWTGLTAAAAGVAARIRAQDNADAFAHARALAAGPNPFRQGGNRTHAAIISHRLPEVAARLKAQAQQ